MLLENRYARQDILSGVFLKEGPPREAHHWRKRGERLKLAEPTTDEGQKGHAA